MTETETYAKMARARRILDAGTRVTVLTGAGISTDSGIPDFRGPNGVWTKNPKAERTSNIEYYVSDPEVRRLAWQGRINWMEQPRSPNAGHRALLPLEQRARWWPSSPRTSTGCTRRQDPTRIASSRSTARSTRRCACRASAARPMTETLDRVRAGDPDPVCLAAAACEVGDDLVRPEPRRAPISSGPSSPRRRATCCWPSARRSASTRWRPWCHGRAEPARRIVIVNAERTEMDDLADVVIRGSISEVLPQSSPDGQIVT